MGYEKLSRETSPVEASGQKKKKNFPKALSYFLINIHLTAGNGAVYTFACIKGRTTEMPAVDCFCFLFQQISPAGHR